MSLQRPLARRGGAAGSMRCSSMGVAGQVAQRRRGQVDGQRAWWPRAAWGQRHVLTAPSQHSAPMPLAQPCPTPTAVASRFGAHASPARSYLRICPPRAVPVRCRPGVSWGSVWLRRCSLLCYTYVLFPLEDPLRPGPAPRERNADGRDVPRDRERRKIQKSRAENWCVKFIRNNEKHRF